ncbi:MAG: hypothetical protein PHS56_10150 [Eubacteriales bacterium]|nr:hypothetical protein [Eubacteriales bacterium]
MSLLACTNGGSDLVKVADSRRGKSSGWQIDGSSNAYRKLPAMLNNADLIVVGKVVNQDDFGDFSVITEVKVGRTVKGLNYDVVSIIQLKDGYELAIGEEYLLALASLRPDYEEDYYSVCASCQGAFRQEEIGIEVYDDTFLPEIQRFIAKGQKESLSLYELADWFETIIKK